MDHNRRIRQQGIPWNKGQLIGQKAPLKLREIWGHTGSAVPQNRPFGESAMGQAKSRPNQLADRGKTENSLVLRVPLS
jgi:hypothetical protein